MILGILATIVVLGIGAFQDTGKKQACVTSARTIEAAAAANYAKTVDPGPPSYGTISSLESDGYLKNFSNPWGLPDPDSDGQVATTVCNN